MEPSKAKTLFKAKTPSRARTKTPSRARTTSKAKTVLAEEVPRSQFLGREAAGNRRSGREGARRKYSEQLSSSEEEED